MTLLRSLDEDAVRDLQRQVSLLANLAQFSNIGIDSYRGNLWSRIREGIKQYRRWKGTWDKPESIFNDLAIWQMARTGNSPFYNKKGAVQTLVRWAGRASR